MAYDADVLSYSNLYGQRLLLTVTFHKFYCIEQMTTKEKFLRSALKLFASQGIDKTSTAQITNDLGMSSGALFRHFKTKQDLVDTLYLRIKTEAMGNLGELINLKNTPKQNFKLISQALINYFLSHYKEFVFIELVENDPQVSKEALSRAQEVYKDVSKEILKWKKEGYLKDFTLDFLGNLLWNTMMGIIKYLKSKKVNKVEDKYLDLLWQTIGK